MSIEYFTVAVLGVCLLGLVGALIFSQSFRTDLAVPKTPTNDAAQVSFLGLSVQGAVIVVLVALMAGALVYIVQQCFQNARDISSENAPFISITDLTFPFKDKADALRQIKAAKEAESVSIDKRVKALSYDSDPSPNIRALAINRSGPWGMSAKSKETYLTVPAKIPKGEAWACPSALGKTFEVRSRHPNAAEFSGEVARVTFARPLISSADCDEKFDHILVACDLAEKILGDGLLTCDKNNQPRWKGKPKAPIFLTEVAT